VEKAGRSFLAPIGDTRYGDDTLIALVLKDAGEAPPPSM